MPNRLVEKLTPEEYRELCRKMKYDDAVHNINEIVAAAQKYYLKVFPHAGNMSLHKIRSLYLFLFDLIIYSIERGATINIYNFGTFRRYYCKGSPIYDNITHKPAYRRSHYRICFNPSKRFKDVVNNPNLNAFENNALLYEKLYEEDQLE